MTTLKTPTFRGLKPASPAASRSKKANRKTDSRHEVLLRRELTRIGIRYRKNSCKLIGTPDVTIPRAKIAVFCDGDFWHGRDWARLRRALQRRHNADYWVAKILRNRRRDREVSQELARMGWHVLRLWETDILKNPVGAAEIIRDLIDLRSHP